MNDKCRCFDFYRGQNGYKFCPDCGRELVYTQNLNLGDTWIVKIHECGAELKRVKINRLYRNAMELSFENGFFTDEPEIGIYKVSDIEFIERVV